MIPAVEVDEEQNNGEGATASKCGGLVKQMGVDASADRCKTVVVTFVGGVTQSELAGLRRVAASGESRFPRVFTEQYSQLDEYALNASFPFRPSEFRLCNYRLDNLEGFYQISFRPDLHR